MSETPPFPRITVITPSFNQGRYLSECISSVLGQGYPNLEYFVIDGGSTDESISIIQEHSASIDYWVSEPDHGQSDAINKGIRRASGELVAWLNSDDYYLPGAFEQMAQAYRRNPWAPFYFGNGVRVDESGNEISRFCPTNELIFDREALLMGLNYILQPAAFINQSALEQAGPLDASLQYGMDSELWMRLSSLGEPQPVQTVLAASREYGETKTASGLFERIEELRQISRRYSKLHMTPGVLCYFLDTLNRHAREHGDAFPAAFLTDLIMFQGKAAKLLEKYHARSDGFPCLGLTAGPAPQPAVGNTTAASRPLSIGIDLRPIVLEASGGISQLVKGVCEAMFALFSQHRFFVFCTAFNRSLLDFEGEHVRYFSLPVANYFEELDRIAEEESLDALFRSYPTEDSLRFPLCKQVVLVPDNQHETYPEFFDADALRARRAAFSRVLGGAGSVGAISEFSRRALIEFPGTQCRDIFVMSPSILRSREITRLEDLSESERASLPTGQYLLYPANLWKHKNHARVLQAFNLLVQTGRDVSLILTGHPDGWRELAAQNPGLPVRHLGFVRPEFLSVLYQRARAVVFFSLYEGFGIPLLEAFDAGTPVICSDTTSLPEVGGDAVMMCDPTNVAAMAQLMDRILSDDSLRNELISRGKDRLNAYSWEQSAHSLMQACSRVAGASEQLHDHSKPIDAPLPLVSIVTPSYNQGRFLKRTIDSVLEQDYPNVEYVVVDGGSNDESVDILQSYGDRFAWVSEPDRGQADAINKGFARSRGQILAYLNSDDVLLPGAVSRVVHFFQQHPDWDMIYGNADYIDEQDRVTGAYRTAAYSFERLMQDCMVCQPAAFWRRQIAERVGPFNERLNYAMDYDYWQRIDRAGGNIRFVKDKLACSRRYPATKTLSARAQVYREIFRVCRDNAGFVHRDFFIGYWHHVVHERNSIQSQVLRRIPGLVARIAWLHHKWHNRDRYTWKDVRTFLINRTRRRAARVSVWIERAFGLGSWLGSGRSVTGYATDNWLGPVVAVPPRTRAPGRILHFAGIAPIDNVVTFRAGHTVVARSSLIANQYTRISFPSDSIDGQLIRIEFSDCLVDAEKRRLSFLLQDTNIFAEQDAR